MSISAGKSFPTAAIVGAGMAGLACAAPLRAAGAPVSVFDKGCRPGGRMSNRGVDDRLSFDHDWCCRQPRLGHTSHGQHEESTA
jgi:phytoene dehydrogenase-like protein